MFNEDKAEDLPVGGCSLICVTDKHSYRAALASFLLEEDGCEQLPSPISKA